MRAFLLLLAAFPLCAQGWNVSCEASDKTLRLLEAVQPLDDPEIPYEQRIGALRLLAQRNPGEFFIQRAYQDSFRQRNYLGDEFDQALSMYRKWAGNPLAPYYEARLLLYSSPRRSREVLEPLLREHPEFVWPHLEFVDLRGEDAAAHLKAFTAVCPEALITGVGGRGTLQEAAPMRRALERRSTWLDLVSWPALWIAEERSGIGAEVLQARIRGDLKRIESWPFRPDPRLASIYREASRILRDPSLVDTLEARVRREAPDSQLALALLQGRWERDNPPPKPDDKAYRDYQEKRAAAEREWLRRWPNDIASAQDLFRRIESRAMAGDVGVGSVENLAIIDRVVRFRQSSPDASVEFPPLETSLARVYVTGKVRLEQVPELLDLGLRNTETQLRYAISDDLLPEELRVRRPNWGEITSVQTDQMRADYFLATGRPADARALVEQALGRLKVQQGGRSQSDRTEWIRRLADVEAAEGRTRDALVHYQAALGIPKERIPEDLASEPRLAAIKQFYMSHGGTEKNWPEWASAKTDSANISVGRTPPAFVKALPDFTAKDLAGRSWQLRDLKGKATFVNFWATWCAPCRGEHKGLKDLHESIRGRKDIQVLTISVDESPGAVRDYLTEQGYTFPVTQAPELADKLFPYAGLPTNFLVNAQGMRTGMYGFAGDAEGVRRLIEDLEKASRPGR